MCQRLVGVSRSTYYAWADRVGTVSATAARRARLAEQVRVCFEASRQTYGCRRITAELNRSGVPCSVGLSPT